MASWELLVLSDTAKHSAPAESSTFHFYSASGGSGEWRLYLWRKTTRGSVASLTRAVKMLACSHIGRSGRSSGHQENNSMRLPIVGQHEIYALGRRRSSLGHDAVDTRPPACE